MSDTIPTAGDRVTVSRQVGYKMHQERPFECRPACTCGGCNGKHTEYPGVVLRTSYFADNSIESRVLCDDGEERSVMHTPPSGDRC